MSEHYFYLSIDYPDSSTLLKATREEDMEYLRTRVLTDRSERCTYTPVSHTVPLSISRYYEGARTLVDLLQHTDPTKTFLVLKSVSLCIEPNGDDLYACLIASTKLPGSYLRKFRTNNDGEVLLTYKYNGPTAEYREGYYELDVAVTLFEKKDPVNTSSWHSDKIGVKATLRYSQNFETPSVFAGNIQTIIGDLVKKCMSEEEAE